MITVAIVGILAAVAYPSYIEYVNKGRRSQVTAQMLAAGQFMERYYTENRQYPEDAVKGTEELNRRFKNVPSEASDSKANYILELSASSRSSFTIKAARKGVMADDRCGDFTLNNFGVKGLAEHSSAKLGDMGKAIEFCWR
jgi:type IV pilus assembly protein PilE